MRVFLMIFSYRLTKKKNCDKFPDKKEHYYRNVAARIAMLLKALSSQDRQLNKWVENNIKKISCQPHFFSF
jgi:hypothetical protein